MRRPRASARSGRRCARVAAATARAIALGVAERTGTGRLSFSVEHAPKRPAPARRNRRLLPSPPPPPRGRRAGTRGRNPKRPRGEGEGEEPRMASAAVSGSARRARAPASRAASRASSAALARSRSSRSALDSALRRASRGSPVARLFERGGGGVEPRGGSPPLGGFAARSSCSLRAEGERRRLLRLRVRRARRLAAAASAVSARSESEATRRSSRRRRRRRRSSRVRRRHPRDGFDRLDVRLRLRLHLGPNFARRARYRGGVDGAPRRPRRPPPPSPRARGSASRAAVTLDEPDPVLLPQTKLRRVAPRVPKLPAPAPSAAFARASTPTRPREPPRAPRAPGAPPPRRATREPENSRVRERDRPWPRVTPPPNPRAPFRSPRSPRRASPRASPICASRRSKPPRAAGADGEAPRRRRRGATRPHPPRAPPPPRETRDPKRPKPRARLSRALERCFLFGKLRRREAPQAVDDAKDLAEIRRVRLRARRSLERVLFVVAGVKIVPPSPRRALGLQRGDLRLTKLALRLRAEQVRLQPRRPPRSRSVSSARAYVDAPGLRVPCAPPAPPSPAFAPPSSARHAPREARELLGGGRDARTSRGRASASSQFVVRHAVVHVRQEQASPRSSSRSASPHAPRFSVGADTPPGAEIDI